MPVWARNADWQSIGATPLFPGSLPTNAGKNGAAGHRGVEAPIEYATIMTPPASQAA